MRWATNDPHHEAAGVRAGWVYDSAVARAAARITGRCVLLAIALSGVFFGVAHLVPGGICSLYPTQTLAACRSSLGLDSALPWQYLRWMGAYLHGNIGQSPNGASVATGILGGVPASIVLISGALVVYLVWNVSVRLLDLRGRAHRHRALPYVALFLESAPLVWVCLMAVYILTVHWQFLPSGKVDDANIHAFWSDGWFADVGRSPAMVLINVLKHLILPSISLAGLLILVERASGRLVAPAPLFASRRRLTDLPLFASILVSGLIVVEGVFSYGGLGAHFFSAFGGSPPDYAMTLDFLMLGSGVLLLCKLAADLSTLSPSGRADRRVALHATG